MLSFLPWKLERDFNYEFQIRDFSGILTFIIRSIQRAISSRIGQSHGSPVHAQTIRRQNYQFIVVLDLRAGTHVLQRVCTPG